jgi:hypothetical protein
MKFISRFLYLWAIFALLDKDTDPGTPMNPDPIRIRFHKNGCEMATRSTGSTVYHRATSMDIDLLKSKFNFKNLMNIVQFTGRINLYLFIFYFRLKISKSKKWVNSHSE